MKLYFTGMTKLKKTSLILSILLMIALVIDLFLGKGLMMTFYAIISIFIVNVFHPFFKKIFRTDLSFSITLADMLFAVFGTYIGNRFDLYHTFFAYDIMLHFISGTLISLTLYEVFFPSSYRNSIPLVARVSLSMIIGLAGAGFWELCEYFLDIFTGLDVQRNLVEDFELIGRHWQNSGVKDSMNDMFNGTLGSIIAGVVIFFKERRKMRMSEDHLPAGK